MANTYVSLLVHLIFSTKNREPFISHAIEPELFAYIGAIAHDNGSRVLEINAVPDHVHMLISLSKTMSLSDSVKELKKGSSSWIKTKGREFRLFHWQDGYSGLSIGQSGVESVRKYIRKQKEHHRRVLFVDELPRLLEKYGIEYDEKYLWD